MTEDDWRRHADRRRKNEAIRAEATVERLQAMGVKRPFFRIYFYIGHILFAVALTWMLLDLRRGEVEPVSPGVVFAFITACAVFHLCGSSMLKSVLRAKAEVAIERRRYEEEKAEIIANSAETILGQMAKTFQCPDCTCSVCIERRVDATAPGEKPSLRLVETRTADENQGREQAKGV